MNISHKAFLGFLVVILLVGFIGYFGIVTTNSVREASLAETTTSTLVLKINEKGTVAFLATLTEDLNEFQALQARADQLDQDIDALEVALRDNPATRNNEDFQNFLSLKEKQEEDQEKIFNIHNELLTRKNIFGDSYLVEEAVWERLRSAILETNDPALIQGLEDVEARVEFVRAHQGHEEGSIQKWQESVDALGTLVQSRTEPGSRVQDQFSVYADTVDVISEIALREEEIRKEESTLFSTIKQRETVLANIRNNITAELFQQTNRSSQNSRNVLIVALVGAFLLAVFIGSFVSHSIAEPIQKLTQAARDVASGNLDRRVRVKAGGEVGMLARVFNQMTGRIAAYPEELQKEIKKKTKELQQANEKLGKTNKELEEVGKMLIRRDLELTTANEHLNKLDKIKSEFVSVAAHQLRTPLTGVKWSLQGLIDGEYGELTTEQKEVAREGLTATENAVQLIGSLLNVARIEEQRMGFHFANENIRDIILKSLDKVSSKIDDKGIELIQEIPDHLPTIKVDGEKIELVLDNLLDNAIKYTLPGGKIVVSASEESGHVRVSVADTGIGIPKDEKQSLFSKFFRAANAVRLQTSGSGLGLYMVKSILDRHGGEIFVESEEKKGTKFTFTLPLIEAVDDKTT